VPVVAHELADPEKGTGVAMICTFGDTTDVTWWRELDLPTRSVIQHNGRFQVETPDWLGGGGEKVYREIAGLYSNQARRKMAELLTESGDLMGEPKQISHQVKFYEKGERPLEIVTSRQWYIRNGGRDDELRKALLARGAELEWVPEFMEIRYQHWVDGLNGDWLVSRQRFFGVPIPIWYRIDDSGGVVYERPLIPGEADLPIDPSSDVPEGYVESSRGQPGGFVGDPDIMDTWATSSLTPEIAGHWDDDPDLFERVYPMDIRPQGSDIIRTWLFATVVRGHYEHSKLPWSSATINGWILDPDRKKMSKSKGNVMTPAPLLEEYGSEAVRYWACNGRPGVDTAVDLGVVKIGRRLAIKILNASRFALGFSGDVDPANITEPIDRSMLGGLSQVVGQATEAFERFDYARALEVTERSFWSWTDDYLELVKTRAYGEGHEAASAQATLQVGLSVYLRLFAPFLPFVTEEVWSWWREGSIHRASWPSTNEFEGLVADSAILEITSQVLSAVRRVKSDAKVSMRAEVESVSVTTDDPGVEHLRQGESDLRAAARAERVDYSIGEFSVESILAVK